MTTLSKTTQTFPQRKAVAIRRALGMLALVGLFALPQAASAQSRDQRGDGDRVERQITHLDHGTLTAAQATRLRARLNAQQASRPAPSALRPDSRAVTQRQRSGTSHASRQDDRPRGQRDDQRDRR